MDTNLSFLYNNIGYLMIISVIVYFAVQITNGFGYKVVQYSAKFRFPRIVVLLEYALLLVILWFGCCSVILM